MPALPATAQTSGRPLLTGNLCMCTCPGGSSWCPSVICTSPSVHARRPTSQRVPRCWPVSSAIALLISQSQTVLQQKASHKLMHGSFRLWQKPLASGTRHRMVALTRCCFTATLSSSGACEKVGGVPWQVMLNLNSLIVAQQLRTVCSKHMVCVCRS